MLDLESKSRKYLATWDRRAILRNERRCPVTRDGLTENLVPVSFCPVLGCAEVKRRSVEVRRFIATQAAYGIQEQIAMAETDLVSALATEIANRPRSVPIPDAARQVLLTIGADEVYHAYLAREFMFEASRLSGIEILPDLLPGEFCLKSALRAVRPKMPSSMWPDFQVLALCFTEMLLADEVLELTREAEGDNAFDLVMKEHFKDEGRHKAFFYELLRYFWGRLDDEIRAVFASLLPRFLDLGFGDPTKFDRQQRALLIAAGLDAETAKRAWGEVFDAGRYDKRNHPMWKSLKTGLDRCGLLMDSRVFDALEDAGWGEDGETARPGGVEAAMTGAN